jgi:hypothetical protein
VNATPAAVVASIVALGLAGLARADCGDDLPGAGRREISAPGVALAFAPRDAPLAVGRPFGVDVAVCASPGRMAPTLLRVDADMPLHRHGMNYRPELRVLGTGRYAVDGMFLHMPGRWRFTFELQTGEGRTLQLERELEIE